MKYIIPFFILLSAFDAYATKCIGYYTSNNLITSNFGNVGDQFSIVNIKGDLSWATGHTRAYYKSSIRHNNGVIYSIALPKKIKTIGNNYYLNITVPGKTPYNISAAPSYNAWFVQTEVEKCRIFENWSDVPDTFIDGGNIKIQLEGTGLPSGSYSVRIPYTIGWGADTNESEGDRILGLWREVNPAVNRTGFFDVTFEVKNNCQQTGVNKNVIAINYGDLSLDKVNGAKKSENYTIFCHDPTTVKVVLMPEKVDLKENLSAELIIKNSQGDKKRILFVDGQNTTTINIESVLKTDGNILPGKFSGSSILSVKYE